MKKQWISVKCGLSRDPKHRRKMGKSIWTFLHMLDLADWETGTVYDWKDENAAEDMGIDIRVLREDRRKLEEEDYISCRQKQHGQDITIKNWTNPREYSGEVKNKKTSPSDDEGSAQGDAQGIQKDVVPSYSSKNKVQIKNKADKPPTPAEILLYRDVVSKYPNKGAWDEVVTAIQKISARLGRDATTADLQPFFKAWCTKSGNLFNFSVWLLEWAVSGSMNGNARPAQAQQPAAFGAIDEWLKSKGQ